MMQAGNAPRRLTSSSILPARARISRLVAETVLASGRNLYKTFTVTHFTLPASQLSRIVYLDFSAVVFHYTFGSGEGQPHASTFLRRKEGLKDFGQVHDSAAPYPLRLLEPSVRFSRPN
jgi:hypothetical protein